MHLRPGVAVAPHDGQLGGGQAPHRADDELRTAVDLGVAPADQCDAEAAAERLDDLLGTADDGGDPYRPALAVVLGTAWTITVGEFAESPAFVLVDIGLIAIGAAIAYGLATLAWRRQAQSR